MRDRLFTSDEYGAGELAAASGTPLSRIDHWCREGIVLPDKDSSGCGTGRRFRGAIPILDATEADNLTRAGYSLKQIRRRLTAHRTALAGVPPERRVIERYRRYITTIVQLADLFGRGPDFTPWLAAQETQLKRMERALAQTPYGRPATRLLNLLAEGATGDDGSQPLAE